MMTRQEGLAVVADEHEFYSAGLGELLVTKTGVQFTTARDYRQVLTILEQVDDIALLTLDVALPGMLGADTIKTLRGRFPHVKILVVSACVLPDLVFQAIGAGAFGMVAKSASPFELLLALRTVLAGHIYVPASVTEKPRNWCVDTRATRHHRELTRRQVEIIELLSEGKSNKAIARALGISPSTVKVHLHAAYRSLGVHSRVGAASALSAATASLDRDNDHAPVGEAAPMPDYLDRRPRPMRRLRAL